MGKAIFIYGLCDPRTNEIRYIGKSNKPKARLRGHISEAKRGEKSRKCSWIRQLLSEGYKPSLKILEKCNANNWEKSEIAWIKDARNKGLNLTNVLDGGESPPLVSELTEEQQNYHSQKVSESNKTRKPPNKGRKWGKKYKKKMSEALSGENNPMFGLKGEDHPAYGRVVSNETRERLSEASKGSKNGMYGKTHSDEAKELLSKSSKGRVPSAETKKKRSLSCLMFHAFKRGDIAEVVVLQEEYKNLFGEYCPKYSERE